MLKCFLFSPLLGEDEPNLTNIFQMGWFNHQPVIQQSPPNINDIQGLVGWINCQLELGRLQFFFGRIFDREKTMERYKIYQDMDQPKRGQWIGWSWIEYMIQDISIHIYYIYIYLYIYIDIQPGPPYLPIHFTLFSNHRKTEETSLCLFSPRRNGPILYGRAALCGEHHADVGTRRQGAGVEIPQGLKKGGHLQVRNLLENYYI